MQWWIIVKKEFLDLFRDRKTWITTALLPVILFPALFLIIGNVMAKTSEEASKNIPIAIEDPSGQVKKWIEQNPAFKIQANVPDLEKAVKDGKIRIGLRVDPNYKQKIESLQPAAVSVLYDSSDERSQISAGVLQSHLSMLNQQILSDRLVKLGIQQQSLTPLDIKEVSLATKEQIAGTYIAFIIPLLLLTAVASGGIPAATDLVAGEKERGTLEALLTTPVSTGAVLFAKVLVVSTMGCISAIASLVAFTFSMKSKSFQGLTGSQAQAGVGETLNPSFINGHNILYILLIMILMAIMFGSVQIALSTLAKGFKEASTYMSPIVIVAMLPGYFMMQTGIKDLTTYYFLLPVVNAISIFKEFIFGVINPGHIALVIGSTFAYMLIAIGVAALLFRKESLIFRH